MPKRTWEIVLDSQSHLIQLNHTNFTSKHEIRLDGQLVAHSRHFIDVGSQHTFTIGQHYCEVHIVSNGFQYRYLLFVDGVPFLTREDSRKHRESDKLTQRGIATYHYWHDLAGLLGLKYAPNPESTDPLRQRLLGKHESYVVVMQLSAEKERYSAGMGVLVRHRTANDVSVVRREIMADPAVDRLLGKEATWRCTIESNFSHCVFPYRPLKVSAEQAASQILEWFETINRHTRLVQLDCCEGDNCPDRNSPVQVVLINGFPALLCAHCTTKIPGWGGELQQEYQMAPRGLSKGLVSGLGIALLGALAWAVVAVAFNALAMGVSVVVFFGIVRLMNRIGVKRSGWSLLLAASLTLLSAVLGAYLTLMWEAASELPQGSVVSSLPNIVSAAWQSLGSTRLLRGAIGFFLVAVIPLLLWMWWEQRRYYSRMFRPEVEVVGPKWF